MTMAGKRRQHTAEFKAQVVLSVLSGEKTASEVCREHKLNSTLLNRWCTELREQAFTVFERTEMRGPDQERICELERLVGQLTMQLEIAKKASSRWRVE
jgi:transposase